MDGRNLLIVNYFAGFKKTLNQLCGINSIHDYYRMVEQTGSIFMEYEYGNMHASNLSDIFIRRPHDFSIADVGERYYTNTIYTPDKLSRSFITYRR